MNVLDQLATALGRNDERPNIELAERLARRGDEDAIADLVQGLGSRDRAVRSDAIKVLYEVGERAPLLIVPFLPAFVDLLSHKDNRLVWGGMCAIDAIASIRPDAVRRHLARIDDAARRGSVITRDHAVKTMAKLVANKASARGVLPLLVRHLRDCPVNQLAMYAEVSAATATRQTAPAILAALRDRLPAVHHPPKRRRLEKAVRKLEGVA